MGEKLPAGLYETLITDRLQERLGELPEERVRRTQLDPGDAHVLLARHLYRRIERRLEDLGDDPARQLELTNELLELLDGYQPEPAADDPVVDPAQALEAIGLPSAQLVDEVEFAPRPRIPLGSSDLLVNARAEPRLGHTLQRELRSADRVDLICAFVRWTGLRLLEDALGAQLARNPGTLRVITTTYMGVTEQRALERLARLGAQVRVCHEESSTRLHAKAWLLHRDSGFSTAFVGSSNLSRSALLDGMEWNVRLSQVETPEILEKFSATFEEYWEDELFEPFDPDDPRSVERLQRALQARSAQDATPLLYFDLRPYPHQQEILELLQAERHRHDRWRNLVVSATGTGKTMIAAFDFKRWYQDNPQGTLLFVAHRQDILEQSLQTFRAVLRDGSFGELLVGGHRPQHFKHVFASIQSLSSRGVDTLLAQGFDFVIVDEFHHAEARTYSELLEHLEPRVLLGLTATPERSDGQSVLHWFDGHVAAELRLWEALERQLLAPFQYFGLHDNTDLRALQWSGSRYDDRALSNLYTGDHRRVALIIEALNDVILEPHAMRALAFCVSIDHAKFMATQFERAGLRARALTSEDSQPERKRAKQALRDGELQVLFVVDLFNEGVDIPEVDTILFLRPTESATIFLQQLGRGLRHAPGKSCLTVLDFIGHAHQNFRHDLRFRALTGATRAELEEALDGGFPFLPPGCSIELDEVAQQTILDNIKRSVGSTIGSVVDELQRCGDVDMETFLDQAALSPEEIYQTKSWYWTKLRRRAGFETRPAGPHEEELGARLHRLLHIDAEDRLGLYKRLLRGEEPPEVGSLDPRQRRLALMLHIALFGGRPGTAERFDSLEKIVDYIWAHEVLRQELAELLTLLDARAEHQTPPLGEVMGWDHPIPLCLHARYSRDEILAALGLLRPGQAHFSREGVLWVEELQTDIFFVTLAKTEEQYSPKTLYQDYAISRRLFHWESQNSTSADTPTGRRYVEHQRRGSHVLLFVRKHKKIGQLTQPYTLLGPARYARHKGEKPMAIVWELLHPMPTDLFVQSKVLAG